MVTTTRVLTVFGTRPEAIKMAPVIHALDARPDRFRHRICVTAQHRHMLDQVLAFFSLRPDYDLDVMTSGQSPSDVFARVTLGLGPILEAEKPDWVLVQGDTTTTTAAALAANYWGAKVGHIEAGLRTFDKTQPFPEEINRVVVTSVADMHFAPTTQARINLLCEGVKEQSVFVTGNPGIDALFYTLVTLNGGIANNPLAGLPRGRTIILVTAHRRENFGAPLESICHAVQDVADRYQDRVHFLYPVHPNRQASETALRILGPVANVSILQPLDYRSLVYLLLRSDFVLTDSGGLQEEAPSLGKPVLVMRNLTERPEGVDAGVARLVGTNRARIVRETARLLDDGFALAAMAQRIDLYGDGKAARRIVSALAGETIDELRAGAGGVVGFERRQRGESV